MKKITLLLLSFVLFSNFQLMAQWFSPSGTVRTYSFDNIGIGTSTPATKLHVSIPSGFLTARFTNAATSGDRTALIDIQNGQGVLWRYGVGGVGNGLGINNGQFYIERAGLGSVLALTTAGNVGIGTVAPQKRLHVDGNEILSTGVTAGFQFRNRGSVSGADDWVWYSQDNIARLWRAGVGDLLGITTGGNFGIGTIAPSSYKLKVAHGAFGLNVERATTGNDWEIFTSGISTDAPLQLFYNGSFRGSFNASTGVYSSGSDERLKTNIKAMPTVLEKVNQLKPATYQFKASNTSAGNIPESYGFMAQDVMKLFPNLVTHHEDKERGLDTYTMDYSGFGIIAIKAIQELQQTNQEQILKNNKLEERVAKLEAALSAIKTNNPNLINKRLIGVSLEQNHPNPVEEITTFRYTIPEGVSAQIIIRELTTGKLVKTLPATASGKVQLNGQELESGIYVYSLMVDGELVDSKQMVFRSK